MLFLKQFFDALRNYPGKVSNLNYKRIASPVLPHKAKGVGVKYYLRVNLLNSVVASARALAKEKKGSKCI